MLRSMIALFVLAPSLALAAPTKVSIDTVNSRVDWHGSKAVIKDSHSGTVKIADSSFLTVEGDKVTGGEIVVDMTTVNDTDLTDPAYKAKLEGHLQSEDFFDTKKYKDAKFVIKKVTPQTEGTQLFEGDLTVRGVTQPAKVTATVGKEGKAYTAKGKLDFDRTKFNIKYNSKAAFPDLIKTGKDKIIADKIDLEFNVKTK